MKKKWLSAAAAAVLSVCALAAPISVPNTVTPVAVQAASSGTTLADMPSTYQSAAEWILQNSFQQICHYLCVHLRGILGFLC